MVKAKLSTQAHERQALLNPFAAQLWCKWYQIGSIETLYNQIADDPSLISRIDRFTKGLKALKQAVVA